MFKSAFENKYNLPCIIIILLYYNISAMFLSFKKTVVAKIVLNFKIKYSINYYIVLLLLIIL